MGGGCPCKNLGVSFYEDPGGAFTEIAAHMRWRLELGPPADD